MHTAETRKAVLRLNAIKEELTRLHNEIHRQEEWTEAERTAAHHIFMAGVQLLEAHGELSRQWNRLVGGK